MGQMLLVHHGLVQRLSLPRFYLQLWRKIGEYFFPFPDFLSQLWRKSGQGKPATEISQRIRMLKQEDKREPRISQTTTRRPWKDRPSEEHSHQIKSQIFNKSEYPEDGHEVTYWENTVSQFQRVQLETHTSESLGCTLDESSCVSQGGVKVKGAKGAEGGGAQMIKIGFVNCHGWWAREVDIVQELL